MIRTNEINITHVYGSICVFLMTSALPPSIGPAIAEPASPGEEAEIYPGPVGQAA